ncbi:MAG: PPOX class F420-dependent oxidoreductase [Ilumatobacteraceae bacterium]
MGLEDEKYISFTTFKRDGTAVATAVWIVALDGGKYGFWTGSTAGKAKRLKNNPKVLMQPCDSRGRVKSGSTTTEGTAVVVVTGAEADAVRAKITAKYGFMVTVTKALRKLNNIILRKKEPYGDIAIVITPA